MKNFHQFNGAKSIRKCFKSWAIKTNQHVNSFPYIIPERLANWKDWRIWTYYQQLEEGRYSIVWNKSSVLILDTILDILDIILRQWTQWTRINNVDTWHYSDNVMIILDILDTIPDNLDIILDINNLKWKQIISKNNSFRRYMMSIYKIYRFVFFKRVSDESLAQDITSETFTRLWKEISEDNGAKNHGFLFKVARVNLIFDCLLTKDRNPINLD